MTRNAPGNIPDVVVIGGGLIGMSCAAAAAERGFSVRIVGERVPGEASIAAAGLLAPSIERGDGPSHEFAVAARDRYPSYLAWLRDETGVDVPLNRRGIIQLAVTDAGIRGLKRAMPGDARWFDAGELAVLEPALAHGLGGALHEADGAVDNVALVDALRRLVENHPRISWATDRVTHLRFVPTVSAVGMSGATYYAERVVLAAGAWSATIAGLPRVLPVEPVRGQMIAYRSARLTRPVYGPTGYVVPRPDGRTLVGATVERAGFESVTTDAGVARLRRTASEILPELAELEPVAAWAGIRPMSPDLQPILGADPDEPRLVYATGHSRNGVLMTPLTADCVASILAGEPPPAELSPFSVDRWQPSTPV